MNSWVTMTVRSKARWPLHLTATAGATLLELMAAVAIMALVTALAVPSYTAWSARSKLKEALTELHGNINLARMSAMNLNTTVQVALAIVNNQVTASFTTTGGGTVMPEQVMDPAVTNMGGVSQIMFNSLGLLVGAGTTNQAITLINSFGVTFEIQVTPAGKARWCTVSPCPS